MALEHCSKAGCRDPFTAGNYLITTCPYDEWKITVDFEIELADMRHGRQLKRISELVQSEAATQAKLSAYEVIAVVLYTGPMVFFPFFSAACVNFVIPDFPSCFSLLSTIPY
jgi:hypothetical protein